MKSGSTVPCLSLLFWVSLCACTGATAPALSERDPCDLCGDGTTCLDGECVDDAQVCGGRLCEAPGVCLDGVCRQALTVATFNLYDLTLPGSPANVARFIAERGIDLILFQEIQPSDAADLVQSLAAEGVELHYAFSSRGGYGGDPGDDYLAAFSRLPITDHETILGGTLRDPVTGESFSFTYMRPVHRVRLSAHGQELIVYNLHLKAQVPFPDCEGCLERRRAQASALERYILERDDPEADLVIVAGDANSALAEDFEPGNTLDRLTLRSDNPDGAANDFTPVNFEYRNEPTHNDFNSLLDHLILSPALMHHYIPDSVEVVAPAGRPSDHKAVLLRLAF
jgi:endonuclease/exonuclease/phosphatase family metal-dependent hydrolase